MVDSMGIGVISASVDARGLGLSRPEQFGFRSHPCELGQDAPALGAVSFSVSRRAKYPCDGGVRIKGAPAGAWHRQVLHVLCSESPCICPL